jgi:hypothetical protein
LQPPLPRWSRHPKTPSDFKPDSHARNPAMTRLSDALMPKFTHTFSGRPKIQEERIIEKHLSTL